MVLATAHDMGREWRFISALAPFGVPVAPPVAFCRDTDVIGAEFYLMGFVDGEVLGDAESGHRLAEGEPRTAAGLDTADVLAALHAVDPDAAGLSDLRRDGSYIERQLRRWHRQVHASSRPTSRSSTPRTSGSSPGPPRYRRRTSGSRTATTAPATSPTGPTAGFARSSTGSWPPWATRSPTSAG